MNYLTRRPNEILTETRLGSLHGWKSTSWKLRRRGSFDFPVLSVAAAARLSTGGVVIEKNLARDRRGKPQRTILLHTHVR